MEPRLKGSENGRVNLCGVAVDRLGMPAVVARIHSAVSAREALAISMVNVAKVVTMRRDAGLRARVESSDLILADGLPLVWLSRVIGDPLPERVAGIDLMHEIFKLADRHGLRVYFLGARSETLQRVIEIARERHPGMVIAGFRDGYFLAEEEGTVAKDIHDARTDILLVAMSSPKKEIFLDRWSSILDVPVCHGVGGSFDVMAGVTRRAPQWMQRCGLEWFYRMIQEPRRMWKRYLVTNTVFVVLAIGAILGRKPSRRKVIEAT